jgi:hypothetical protein
MTMTARSTVSELPRVRPLLPWLILVSAAVVTLLYGSTLRFDLFWDDFSVLRPWHAHELSSALTGSYRPHDPDALFYRPLASLYYAAAFELFGLNTRALHVLPIVNLTVIAVLVGVYTYRATRRRLLACLAAAVYAGHPTVADAIGPWIAIQYHGFLTIAALGVLLATQRDSTRGSPRWIALLPWLIAGFLLEEEGTLFPLLVPALQSARAFWLRDRPSSAGRD